MGRAYGRARKRGLTMVRAAHYNRRTATRSISTALLHGPRSLEPSIQEIVLVEAEVQRVGVAQVATANDMGAVVPDRGGLTFVAFDRKRPRQHHVHDQLVGAFEWVLAETRWGGGVTACAGSGVRKARTTIAPTKSAAKARAARRELHAFRGLFFGVHRSVSPRSFSKKPSPGRRYFR